MWTQYSRTYILKPCPALNLKTPIFSPRHWRSPPSTGLQPQRSITERLNAPVGSFYYRFASRDLLLGELWLQTVLAFQEGVTVALDAGDGLGAVLHTPGWVREHL